MRKLKPCPFCGNKEVVPLCFNDYCMTETVYDESEGDGKPWIHCYGCDSDWNSDMDDAIEAWNRRTSDE